MIVGLIGFAMVKGMQPTPYTPFAQCLTDQGAVMYGAWWCPHCKEQKETFGKAFKEVDYVECSDSNKHLNQVCKDAGISGFPTWKFSGGSTLEGPQDLSTLAEKTNCELP